MRAQQGDRLALCSVCRGDGEVTRYGSAPKGKVADIWIGFSTDEIQRVSPSRMPYLRNVYPLLDIEMSREQCETYLTERGWSATKSACIGCPFHGNRAWRELRDERPDEWADAVAFDHAVRSIPGHAASMNGVQAFLHTSRVPLDQAPIDPPAPNPAHGVQGSMFDLAEEGDPDGCSPYGCRSGVPGESIELELPPLTCPHANVVKRLDADDELGDYCTDCGEWAADDPTIYDRTPHPERMIT
jgi:hypothetical protein